MSRHIASRNGPRTGPLRRQSLVSGLARGTYNFYDGPLETTFAYVIRFNYTFISYIDRQINVLVDPSNCILIKKTANHFRSFETRFAAPSFCRSFPNISCFIRRFVADIYNTRTKEGYSKSILFRLKTYFDWHAICCLQLHRSRSLGIARNNFCPRFRVIAREAGDISCFTSALPGWQYVVNGCIRHSYFEHNAHARMHAGMHVNNLASLLRRCNCRPIVLFSLDYYGNHDHHRLFAQ